MLETFLKTTALLGAAWMAVLFLRRKSAALRHQIWILALAAVLALPLFSNLLPALHVPIGKSFSLDGLIFYSQALAGMSASAPETNFARIFAILWALGAAVSLTQILMGWLTVERLRRNTQPIALPEVDAPIEVRETPAGSMPITYGLFRPVILLPADAHTWSAERRHVVLLHELAHVRRKDGATHLLARIALAFYWWHPLVWTAWRESVKERERAADDAVLNSGASATDYAGHLLEIARSLQSPAGALAMADRSQLHDRLAAILDSNRDRRAPQRVVLLVAALTAVAILVPVAALRAKNHPTAMAAPPPAAALHIGGDVKTPILLSKVEPEYSYEARMAKYSGAVLLYIEIAEDGSVREVKVTRPLGMGLDQKAIEAVKKWKFAPGTRNGQPVAVSATVEVDFRLQ